MAVSPKSDSTVIPSSVDVAIATVALSTEGGNNGPTKPLMPAVEAAAAKGIYVSFAFAQPDFA